MKSDLGENLRREWETDPHAHELWDGLQAMKVTPATGIKSLEKLGEDGSPLAMMHLGYIYLTGQFGVVQDVPLGEAWMRRSADRGSTEARYRLAKHLQTTGRGGEALCLYEALANAGYAPASFVLGLEYFLGDIVAKDIAMSLAHFRRAYAAGHMHAAHRISFILMKVTRTPVSWIRGFWLRLYTLIPAVRLMVNYPNSDRLRQ